MTRVAEGLSGVPIVLMVLVVDPLGVVGMARVLGTVERHEFYQSVVSALPAGRCAVRRGAPFLDE
jgi:hypothetical protein